MLKVLLQKQLAEIFRTYFYNAKTNKARSRGATIAYLVGFALLMVGLLGGIFAYLSVSLCGALSAVGMDWLFFALMGLLIIVLFYRSAKEHNDAAFRWMWLTIVLSFGFYIPVVLWADTIPMIGMLMIPKTCAYVWTVLIGFFAMKKECK